MAVVSFRTATVVALLAAALYQTLLRDVLTTLGVGRQLQSISEFPYTCRRVGNDVIQACEDMWLDEEDRKLYLACSNVPSRQHWLPNMGHNNASGRYMKETIVVLDIDKSVGESFQQRVLATSGFYGTAGDGVLHGLAVSGRKIPGSSKIQFYIVNNKPAVSDHENGIVPEIAVANATIELFEHDSGSSKMKYIRTFAHELIATPNNVAILPDGSGFYLTNDHGLATSGWQHKSSPLFFTGNVVYCSTLTSDETTSCRIVARGLSFPNGPTINPLDPKTLYVPSSGLGIGVTVYRIQNDKSLTKLAHIKMPYVMDNLSPASDGSIYAPAFPKVPQSVASFSDPDMFADRSVAESKTAPATVLKINKIRNLVNDGKEITWSWEKVIEDGEAKALPGATTALLDGKTGRLFVSGVHSYFITVCEPK